MGVVRIVLVTLLTHPSALPFLPSPSGGGGPGGPGEGFKDHLAHRKRSSLPASGEGKGIVTSTLSSYHFL
jgi:hypothetical protein